MTHIQRDQASRYELPAALADYTAYLLRRVYGRAERIAQDVMPAGRHPRDVAVLRVLAEGDARSQQQLAARLGINRTIMVALIDRLEDAGQVQRRRTPTDRRTYTLSITAAGRRLLKTTSPAMARGEAELTASLSDDEREGLNRLLEMLIPDLVEAGPQGAAARSAYLLLHAHRRLKQRGDEGIASLGLHVRDFGALTMLNTSGPCTQQQLARQLDVAGSVMVQIVDHLEDCGFVERRRDVDDRRRYALQLTDAGQGCLAKARSAIDSIQADVTSILGVRGDKKLRTLLRKIAFGS